VEVMDLSFAEDFDWRDYVCNHSTAQTIVGPGIWKFEGRFVNTLEPNRKSHGLLGPFGVWRFDFVALRTDGTAVRLHPSQGNEAKPIHGVLSTWRLHEVRASTPGAAIAAMDGAPTFDVLGRVDFVSNKRAFERATQLFPPGVDTWDPAREHDLTGDQFPWDRWLMGRPWGKALASETLTSMTIGWHKESFRIRVTTLAKPGPINIRLSTSGSWLSR